MNDEPTVVWMDDLDAEACWTLLDRVPVGRVAFVLHGETLVLPVNHRIDGHSVLIRTGEGALLNGLAGGGDAAFEVDEMDAFSETGWSVLVKGNANEVSDPTDRAEVERLNLHPWATGRKDHWIRIVPRSVTGRAISRRRSSDGSFLPYMPPD
jgi:nitroimidazol reductase NimA-like FMN-containing flavoprotein (pyridoxamine 5'-phosphate oxidase superfamily)